MTRKEIIAQLRAAKTAHIQWRAYAQALVAGFAIDQNLVPVIHTDCKFGQWYYGQGQSLSNLKHFAEIDKPHVLLHQEYMNIYKLIFTKTKPGLFDGLFNSQEKRRLKNVKQAEELMKNLAAISEELLASINSLEQEVIAMIDSQINELY